MTTKEALAMPAPVGLGQRAAQMWQGLSPMARHSIMGAGAGLGASLLGGPDEQGQTHYLRNMALGAGGGALASKYGPGLMQRAQEAVSPAQQSFKFSGLAAAYEAGKQSALGRYNIR